MVLLETLFMFSMRLDFLSYSHNVDLHLQMYKQIEEKNGKLDRLSLKQLKIPTKKTQSVKKETAKKTSQLKFLHRKFF